MAACASKPLPSAVCKGGILVATLIWGLSFVVMKDAVDVMEPSWLLGVRFLLTALIMTAVFWKHVRAAMTRDSLVRGLIMGLLIFAAYWTQTVGLVYTTPGKNAFITGSYVVMVPFIYWIAQHRRPTVFNALAAGLCIVGLGMVSLTGDELTVGFGDLMTMICALFFALHIVYVNHASEGCDVLALTVFQFWVMGICGVLLGLITEPLPQLSAVTPEFLFNMAYLVILASCVALLIQNVAFAHVAPAPAAVLLSTEAVFGVMFSIILYGEVITAQLALGFTLILAAIIASEALPFIFGKRRAKGGAEGAQGSVSADLAAGEGARRSAASHSVAGEGADALATVTAAEREFAIGFDEELESGPVG